MFLYFQRLLFTSDFSHFIYSYFSAILATSARQGVFLWPNTQQAAVKDEKKKTTKKTRWIASDGNLQYSVQSLAAYNKSISQIYCSNAAAWPCTITMFNSVHVLAGIVSVTAIGTSSGNAQSLSTLMDLHGELSCTTAPLPLNIQSHANTDMQLCAHKLSPVCLLRGTSL